MSEYPSDWEITNLGDLASIKASNVDKKTKEGQRDILLCNYMDVFKNPVVSNLLEFMKSTASEKEISEFSLSRGDVLLTKDSEVPEEIGIPSVVTEDISNLVCGYHLYMIRADHSRINPEYLCWTLRSNSLRQYFYQMANGSTRFGLNLKHIEECPVAIPPLPEQKKIAEILSGIDHLIRREDECHDAMSSLLQSHLRSQRFSNGESIAISDACLLVADCMHKTPAFEETGFPIVRTPNVRDGRLVHEGMKFISEESYREWIQKDKPEPGDILFTREAPLGEACLVPKDFPLCIGQRMMLLRANPRILSPEFLLFRLRSLATQQKLQLLSGGSTVGHANVKDIRNLEIEIPNESEQRIATSIYESISCCIDKHATKKQKLLHLKQALATDLLSGRKRVTI